MGEKGIRIRPVPGLGVAVLGAAVLLACDPRPEGWEGGEAEGAVVVSRASASERPGSLGSFAPSSALDLEFLGYDQGDPNAPLKVIEVTDFGCGYCRRFNQETFPTLLQEYVETGKIQWKFVPFVLGMFPNGDRAALAAECAGIQGRDAFFRMRDRLFLEQTGWRSAADAQEFFTRLAEDEGLDAGAFSRCLQDGSMGEKVALNNRLGQALGVRGTPLFIIGGIPVPGAQPTEQFRLIFETILAAGDDFAPEWLPHPPMPDGPSITERVVSSGLGYSLGALDAPLNVVEFSDFGCGYCRAFQEETRPTLLREYVEAGLVRWIYVPFVLGIFPNGEEAALAGECAGDQGMFEPMRRRLYQDQAEWRDSDDPESFFGRLADEEGLDTGEFSRCLAERSTVPRVLANLQMGRMAGVRGAPAFLVDGFLVSGAKPLETFKDLLDLKLNSFSGEGS